MNQAECARLQSYLRRLLGAPGLNVRGRNADEAAMLIGEDKIADIAKDEEDGELSYFVNMGVARAPGAARNAPLDAGERARIEKALQTIMGAPGISVRPRPRKTDSAEVYVGDEFIGTLSVDEDSGDVGYFLTMSILDIDLETDE